MNKEVTIYFKSGDWIHFKEVTNLVVSEERIVFNYKEREIKKTVVFFFENIAGWGTT